MPMRHVMQAEATVQSDAVNAAIIAYTVMCPAVLFIIVAVIFGILYPLNKKRLVEQTEELRESCVKID